MPLSLCHSVADIYPLSLSLIFFFTLTIFPTLKTRVPVAGDSLTARQQEKERKRDIAPGRKVPDDLYSRVNIPKIGFSWLTSWHVSASTTVSASFFRRKITRRGILSQRLQPFVLSILFYVVFSCIRFRPFKNFTP